MTLVTLHRMLCYLAAVLFLSAIGFSVPAWAERDNDNRAPDISNLPTWQAALTGQKVAFYAYAEGVQIYRWNGTSWVFMQPRALLYAGPHVEGIVGTHYVGPTWESNSGSYVVGSVLDKYTPDASSIPWLLLKAVDTDGPGIFDGVTFIQRAHTLGGVAPGTPGQFVGEVAEVPYAADYYFYRSYQQP